MRFSNTNSVLLALAAASSVTAHTTFTNFFVNGVEQGDGVCVRMNSNPGEATFPVEDVTSSDMVCGFTGLNSVSRVCPVPDGATLTFEYRSAPDDPSQDAIDPGHVGPCAVYLKKVDSAIKSTGEGDGWFKLFDEGYDEENGQWCNIKLDNNNDHLSVKLPKGLVGGYYLARPELLALHAAVNHDPQFYTGCAQIFIDSSGQVVPTETVSIPGHVSMDDPALTFNVYEKPMALPYPKPGPKPANYEVAWYNVPSQRKQTEGLKPAGCILENANWCAKEVPSYTDQEGCWDAAEDCWNQDRECWDNTPATGGAHCRIWEDKCRNIGDQCKAGNWHGPPQKGRVLTPKKSTIGAGLIMPTSPGGQTVGGAAATGTKKKTNPRPSVTKKKAVPKVTAKPQRPQGHGNGVVVKTDVVTQVVYKTVAAPDKRQDEPRVPVYRVF